MIIITIKSIVELDLPLNSKDMVRKKDQEYKEAKQKVKAFQKEYGYSSNRVARALSPSCQKFEQIIFRDIPQRDRKEWQKCFRRVVSASLKYRFFITFFTVMNLNMDNDELSVNNESNVDDLEMKSLKDIILSFFREAELPEEDKTDADDVMDFKKIFSIYREEGFSIRSLKKIFLLDEEL